MNSLLERVFIIRYLGILICSFTIPIVFLIARQVSASARTALFATILVAALPELMIDVARVGNECLGVLLFSVLTLLSLRGVTIWTGVILGLGLLTKAYFLTAVPALAIIYLIHRKNWSVRAPIVFTIAFAISGWWYVRNRLTTGSWSGLLESTKLAHYSLSQFWQGAKLVDWRNAIDSILLSHIWFGAWSSLHVRSWIYHLFFVIIAAGIAGVAVTLWKNPQQRKLLWPLLLIYGFFWLGQLYNVLLLFLTKGASTSMGWYMYCVGVPEIILLLIGIESLLPRHHRKWAAVGLITLVAALDLYSVHLVSIPYYTGLTSHSIRTGAVPVVHLSQIQEVGIPQILTRLSGNKPPWLKSQALAFSWAAYLVATLTLLCTGWRLALTGKDSPYKRAPDTAPLTHHP